MPRDRRRTEDDEDETQNFWRGLGRDLVVAAIIVALFLGVIYAYTGIWPPLVVVESSSMQHADRESFLGVIDTGDMVFQQAAPDRGSVITYVEGRASGYATYGDFGDVIIFRRASSPTPVIHRAIMYVQLLANGTANVTGLAAISDWEAIGDGGPTTSSYYLRSVTIHRMGFRHDLGIVFSFGNFGSFFGQSGYITMGDHNAYLFCAVLDPCSDAPYDRGWVVRQGDIIGRARGEIPWFGLLKLTLQPTSSCCTSWGDPEAPKNSWDSLVVSLVFLFALPFILEYAARGWTKYVSPRFPPIRWPWQRKTKADAARGRPDGENVPADAGPPPGSGKPPKQGSSGP